MKTCVDVIFGTFRDGLKEGIDVQVGNNLTCLGGGRKRYALGVLTRE